MHIKKLRKPVNKNGIDDTQKKNCDTQKRSSGTEVHVAGNVPDHKAGNVPEDLAGTVKEYKFPSKRMNKPSAKDAEVAFVTTSSSSSSNSKALGRPCTLISSLNTTSFVAAFNFSLGCFQTAVPCSWCGEEKARFRDHKHTFREHRHRADDLSGTSFYSKHRNTRRSRTL